MKMSAAALSTVLCVGVTFGCSSPSSPSNTAGGTPTAPPSPSTPITGFVSIRDSTFAPDPLFITVRSDVTWTNNGRSRHTAVSDAACGTAERSSLQVWGESHLMMEIPATEIRGPENPSRGYSARLEYIPITVRSTLTCEGLSS